MEETPAEVYERREIVRAEGIRKTFSLSRKQRLIEKSKEKKEKSFFREGVSWINYITR